MNATPRHASIAQLVLAALLFAWGAEGRPQSDEPWVSRAPVSPGTQPLLALVVDTSAAMAGSVQTPGPYDPGRDYAAGVAAACDPARVYWRRGPGPAPGCHDGASLPLESGDAQRGFHCRAGRQALDRTGTYVAARAAQWQPGTAGGYWQALAAGEDGAVECLADRGVHGSGDGPWYAAHGTAGPWSRDRDDEVPWDAAPLGESYVFLSGNYLNYLAGRSAAVTMTRYEWMTSLLGSAMQSVDGLDLAVVRLSHDGLAGDDEGRGGMVAVAPVALPGAAAAVAGAVASWPPAGPAPLAESLVETVAWLSGSRVLFGDGTHSAPREPLPSSVAVRDPQQPGNYRSPFTESCRPVSVTLVTAGVPSADAGAGPAAARLPAHLRPEPACGVDCLSALAGALRHGDLLPALPGPQRAPLSIAAPLPATPELRAQAAAAGVPLLDLADPLALVTIMARALQRDAAVAADARLSAAGFSPAGPGGIEPAVYLGLSSPATGARWAGNLRKYRLRAAPSPLAAPAIVDADGHAALDASGAGVLPDSRSAWSARPDGADVALGGAAAALPPPATRRLYADLTSKTLTDPGNRIEPSNRALSREVLGLSPPDPRPAADLIQWLLGADAFDEDGDGERDEPRHSLGDPGLQPPDVLRYGGAEDPALVFTATNDGVLHALNDGDGSERWAFIPRSLLPRTSWLAGSDTSFHRGFGLDGAITRHTFDADGDGRLTPGSGDRAWLVVGLGRGGAGYYALDVTDPDRPRVLWSLVGAAASALGEAWPAAVVARMRLDDRRQGPHRRVVVLAGGHDPAQSAWRRASDDRGARLLILDAESGEVLWQAGDSSDSGVDLVLEGLSASLPSAPRVLDVDGDGLADTFYLLGIAGQLWRIDFTPGADPSGLASARLLGRFGVPDAAGLPPRRFYATPDVSYDASTGRPRFIVAFGSGWLARPRDTSVEDRFYAVFDTVAGGTPPGARVLRDDDLFDVTPAPHEAPLGSRGWYLRLGSHGHGEKVAGAALTFDRRLRFATYQPLGVDGRHPCGPPAGRSRLYTLDVRNGRPVNRVDDRPEPAQDLEAPGLPPALRIAFPPRATAGDCPAGGCIAAPFGLAGGRSLDLDFGNDPVKTTWRRLDPTPE